MRLPLLLLLAMANGTLNSECGTSPVRRERGGGGGWHVRAKAGSLVALYLGALSLCVAPPSLVKFVCCCVGAMELLRATRCVKIGHMVSNLLPFPSTLGEEGLGFPPRKKSLVMCNIRYVTQEGWMGGWFKSPMSLWLFLV